jgi:hypothetical protein
VLTQDQAAEVWDEMIAAEVRSLYFGELGATFTKQKQLISGLSFFFSSGAAAAVFAKMDPLVPLVLSLITAVTTAYSIAVGLDKRAITMAKLYSTWSQIETDCRDLWNHWYEDDAESKFKDIFNRIRHASEQAITDAPLKEDLVKKWTTYVHREHGLLAA